MDQPVKPEPVLTPSVILVDLNKAFPGIIWDQEERIGGWMLKASIWEFDFAISVTSKTVTPATGDRIGMTHFRFSERRRLGKANFKYLVETKTRSLKEIRVCIEKTRRILYGIAAAIFIAFEEPPPPQKANIFQ